MDTATRRVLPEILDHLEAEDPRAVRARRDLQRVHRAMRTISILKRATGRLRLARPPRSILELGGGDGTLLLRLARTQPQWSPVSLTLLDREDLVSTRTGAAYLALGWEVRVLKKDVMDWARDGDAPHHDLCLANLFLHHFSETALVVMMRQIAQRCDALVACEPRRNTLCLLGSRTIGLLGVNHVTRQDAVTSVIAGFVDRELSAAWPADLPGWSCEEYAAFPFTHCFAAVRHGARSPGAEA